LRLRVDITTMCGGQASVAGMADSPWPMTAKRDKTRLSRYRWNSVVSKREKVRRLPKQDARQSFAPWRKSRRRTYSAKEAEPGRCGRYGIFFHEKTSFLQLFQENSINNI